MPTLYIGSLDECDSRDGVGRDCNEGLSANTRDINGCADDEPTPQNVGSAECATWACIAPYRECLVDGAIWPSKWYPKEMTLTPTTAPVERGIWEFFDWVAPAGEAVSASP